MLMEETNEPYGQEQTAKSENTIINIGNDPVMQSAIDVLSSTGKQKSSYSQSKREIQFQMQLQLQISLQKKC